MEWILIMGVNNLWTSGLGIRKDYLTLKKSTLTQDHSVYLNLWGSIGCLIGVTINNIKKMLSVCPGY